MTKILVPVDYSDHSPHVLEFAANFARGLNAQLSVLYVWETMPHFSRAYSSRRHLARARC